ncbi:MAG: BlaI/MecI/CopY family transcriptional regulator [Erysipelotrichaceae bacterium]|nr:BlaI/MecI/CopY family transcriptional regulator [Erysipelotrichaceae bacterium]
MGLTNTEIKFMNLVWQYEPICSTQLVKLCNDQFNWKKSTTYTFIKRLNEKGILVNENTFVKSLISKDDYQKSESSEIINTIYDGSVVKFLDAYLSNHDLSSIEIDKIIELADKRNKPKKMVFQFDID